MIYQKWRNSIKIEMACLFLRTFAFLFFISCSNLYSSNDLTLVGYVNPSDGLGKIPVTILETLGDDLSINVISSASAPCHTNDLPRLTLKALNNPDQSPGKVALLTEGLWNVYGKPADKIPKECLIKLAYSMIESTAPPSMWVKILNDEFDAVVVPDPYLVDVYQNAGVQIPVFVLPIPMLLNHYFEHPVHSKMPSTPFVFGNASANKNPGLTVQAFAKAFGNSPQVHLVMRAVHLSEATRQAINLMTMKYGLTNVSVEEGDLPLASYIERLSSFDCYVNLSHGEGFSFIPREALALGIPVIITNNTASKTICKSGFIRPVPSDKKGPINCSIYRDIFNEECGQQFYCKVEDVIPALRDVYNHYSDYIKKARRGRKWVRQYNADDPTLRENYRALIKPKAVTLGNENKIKNGVITTTSTDLWRKYHEIIQR